MSSSTAAADEVPAMPAHTCPAHGLYFGHSCPNCPDVSAPPLELHSTPDAPEPGDADSPPTETIRAGRYDSAVRRQPRQTGRERGCWVYIPLEEIVKAGIDPDGPPPFYRVWGRERGSVLVRLYKER